jgi:uncharacterized protein
MLLRHRQETNLIFVLYLSDPENGTKRHSKPAANQRDATMSDTNLLQHLLATPVELVFALTAVAVAYTLFTLVGFGSALFAGGPLAMLIPVGRVIPLLAVLDCGGASLRGWRARTEVDRGAFSKLLGGMLAGQLLGVFILAHLPSAPMAAALGLFIVGQGLRGLYSGRQAGGAPYHPFAYGLLGGVLGGLFGSGGFVYASYLERHLASRAAFRATQAALIAISTAWRIVLCLSAGLLDLELLIVALVFVPAMAAGVLLGHRIDLRIDRQQLFMLLNGLLVLSGATLLWRHLA